MAGLAAGLVFLAFNVTLCSLLLASPWLPLQLPAALVFGDAVLPPAEISNWGIPIGGLLVHLALAVAFTCLIAFCLHRWGIWIGLCGGALFGLSLYAINYHFIADFVSGIAQLRGWLMALSHAVFGATAGGIYEFLERDER